MEELKGLIAMRPDLVDNFYGKTSHSDDISDISHEALRRLKLVTQYLVSHNATLLLGSDTPSSPTYANPPGLTSYLEMESLARLGVPLGTLFSAATINNATAFGIDAEVGSIEVGKKANLLILRSNPLQRVEAYREIETIILAGKLHDRNTFSASSN
jgi:imidazolonepropionase-like amidohydrolase